jgi:hypothetical protein
MHVFEKYLPKTLENQLVSEAPHHAESLNTKENASRAGKTLICFDVTVLKHDPLFI